MGFGATIRSGLFACVAVATWGSCCLADDSAFTSRNSPQFRLSVSARSQLMNFARHAELRDQPIVSADSPRWRLLLSDGTVLRRTRIIAMPRLVRSITGDLLGADVNACTITHPDRLLALPEPAPDESMDRRTLASIVCASTPIPDLSHVTPPAFDLARASEAPRMMPGSTSPLRLDPPVVTTESTEVLASLKPDLSPMFVEAGPVEGGPTIKSRTGGKRRR